jgi:hypothetical protein
MRFRPVVKAARVIVPAPGEAEPKTATAAGQAPAGVGPDEHLAAQPAGQPGQREPGGLDIVGSHAGAGVTGTEHDGQRLPFPSWPWSAQAVSGWNPEV